MQRKEWLEWRLQGICASECAVLYGLSKYQTRQNLLEEKVRQIIKDEPPNFVQQKGVELEPKLRAFFSMNYYTETGIEDPFDAECVEHPKKPYLRASLDGLSKDKSVIMEAKYVGKKTLAAGVVPTNYVLQIYHQLMVSGASQAYCVMGDGTNMKIIPVPRDESFIEIHKRKCKEFWDEVKSLRERLTCTSQAASVVSDI